MKVYNTRSVSLTIEVLLITILLLFFFFFFDHWSVNLGARDFSSAVSGFCQVFGFATRGFGLRPKMCRPSTNTENSCRARERPLVPRVLKCSLVPKKSTLSRDRIRGATRSWKALNRINLSLGFFAKHTWLRSRNDSYSQFPRSPLGTPGTMTYINTYMHFLLCFVS